MAAAVAAATEAAAVTAVVVAVAAMGAAGRNVPFLVSSIPVPYLTRHGYFKSGIRIQDEQPESYF
jgi:hypothetical protein